MHCKSCEPMKMASSQAAKCEKFPSNTKIHFQLAGQSLLHGFGRELPKPFFAVLPDLERKSGKGIYQSLIFTNAGNKQGKIFHELLEGVFCAQVNS